jgi:hypothetical protein
MEIGDRVVRKSSERKGYIHDLRDGRVAMVKVRWLDDKSEDWMPTEELRAWDKQAIPMQHKRARWPRRSRGKS